METESSSCSGHGVRELVELYQRDESEKLVHTFIQGFFTAYLVPVLVDWDGDGEVEAMMLSAKET